MNSSTGVLTISTPINITSTFSVNGVPTTPAYTKGTNNLGCGNGVFNILGTGSENVAYGGGALSQVITGAANTAIGYSTLQNLQAGNSNVSIGSSSGSSTSSGSNNIFIGAYSGSYIFGSYECNDCTLLGHGTRASIAGLSGSTCIGINSYITASNQIAIGSNAESIIFRGNVDLNAGGGTATATTQALLDNTTKVATTAFTQSAINRLLYLNTTSGNQMFFNVQFPALTTGYRNIGIGDCFRLLTSGGDNCCIGSLSLNKITTGTENFCLGGLSMREVTSGSFNVSVGVQNLANMTTATGNIAIGRYVMGGLTSGGDNCGIGYFNTVQITSGSSNTAIGPYANFHLRTGNNNTAIGNFAGAHDGGSFINASNNTYVGTDAKMSASSTTYSNSTCLGYNSRITASNGIFLGTATETTYPIGGLNIPTGTLLTLVGNIFANSTTITPSKLSLLSFISGGIVDTGTVGQQVGARKDFNGYDNTAPNYCGSSFVSPVFRPRLFSLNDSIQNSCHAFGSNAARNLLVDPTNSGVYVLGQDNLFSKTTNCFNVCSIGGANMGNFTTENFSGVTVIGQGNLETETGYSMNDVTIMGGTTTFTNGAIKPTSVTDGTFNNAYGIQLASASAISNVFAIRTNQPITKSNQGIIGDSTEITLHSTGQKVIVTGGLEMDDYFQPSIADPTLNWSSANFNMSAVTKFKMVYHLIANTTPTAITLPVVTSAMVGQQFMFKKRGGQGSVVYTITTGGTPQQPIFATAGAIGGFTYPFTLLSATQSCAQLMCCQSHFAGTGGTGQVLAAASPTLTINTWNGLPSTLITIGTNITIAGITKRVAAYGTGRGGTGTYQMETNYAAILGNQPITSTDQFGYDILFVS